MNNAKIPPLANKEEAKNASSQEAWRVFGIMSEFVSATQQLSQIRPAVSIFGSARTPKDSPYFKLAEEISLQLSNAGFSVISGGGPGIMEAVNKGAFAGKSPSIGLNIQLPHEQNTNPYQDIPSHSAIFSRANICLSNSPRLTLCCPAVSALWMN